MDFLKRGLLEAIFQSFGRSAMNIDPFMIYAIMRRRSLQYTFSDNLMKGSCSQLLDGEFISNCKPHIQKLLIWYFISPSKETSGYVSTITM